MKTINIYDIYKLYNSFRDDIETVKNYIEYNSKNKVYISLIDPPGILFYSCTLGGPFIYK